MKINVIHTILCVCARYWDFTNTMFFFSPQNPSSISTGLTHTFVSITCLSLFFFYTFNNFQMVALQHISYNTGKKRGVFLHKQLFMISFTKNTQVGNWSRYSVDTFKMYRYAGSDPPIPTLLKSMVVCTLICKRVNIWMVYLTVCKNNNVWLCTGYFCTRMKEDVTLMSRDNK